MKHCLNVSDLNLGTELSSWPPAVCVGPISSGEALREKPEAPSARGSPAPASSLQLLPGSPACPPTLQTSNVQFQNHASQFLNCPPLDVCVWTCVYTHILLVPSLWRTWLIPGQGREPGLSEVQGGPGKGQSWKLGRGLGSGQLCLARLPSCLRPGCFLLGALENIPTSV